MSEFDLIARFFSKPGRRRDVALGIGDDAAIVDIPSGMRLVAAVDTISEGVHFLAGTEPEAIGHRALAVNLSDIAAMGAQPAWALLSLSMPLADEQWLEAFAAGFFRLADRYSIELVGGDTVKGPLSITVTILGLIEEQAGLTRATAKPGDTIFVSGVPGEAAAGLAALKRNLTAPQLVDRFLWPTPRIELGRKLRQLASAAIDVSDGLLSDLSHICARSSCGAHIALEQVPRSPVMEALFTSDECLQFALGGGDDYELLFTVAPERILDVEAAVARDVRCTPIGRIVEGPGVLCFRGGERIDVDVHGYDHFIRQ